MPNVSGVTATTAGSSTPSTTKGLGSMTSEDFLKILILQLQQQDPMNPMSNEAMVQQISTIRNMEMSTTLTEALQQMTSEQRFAGAAGLIGKYVVGVVTNADGDETTLEGIVTGVSYTSKGKAVLQLDSGYSLPMEKLTEVYAAPTDAPENDTTSSGTSKTVQKALSGLLPTQSSSLGKFATFGLTNKNGLNIGATLG